jgi:hypothetical protein
LISRSAVHDCPQYDARIGLRRQLLGTELRHGTLVLSLSG